MGCCSRYSNPSIPNRSQAACLPVGGLACLPTPFVSLLSGHWESNPVYMNPNHAYYRYTMPRYFFFLSSRVESRYLSFVCICFCDCGRFLHFAPSPPAGGSGRNDVWSDSSLFSYCTQCFCLVFWSSLARFSSIASLARLRS